VQRKTKTSKNLKKVFLTSWSRLLKKVIALLLLAEGFLVVSLNTLHLYFVHLCNEYGEPHYSLTRKGLGLPFVGFSDFGQAVVNEFYF
jgi:hypothetical protein